ncbi:MAG: transporter substrate-binding domain-containing protein [Desulfuromonadaceae bacterium]|nr:transporter substrate-binding domain-containing protein [Desulfuromonadaceae bacterium]
MKRFHLISLACAILLALASISSARTLDEIRQEGVLRHLGVPYANFVTGQGDGLSVELIQRFASYLGVRYEFVPTSWSNVISELTGHQVKPDGKKALIGAEVPVRGDLIANGLTILPWRQQVLDYSDPTFPTQVWLIAAAASPLKPITPSSDQTDITATRLLLPGVSLMGKKNTCLDPALYPFASDPLTTVYFDGNLNDLFPAVLAGEADCTLLDVPDALVAISRWPGEVKVLGPLSEQQAMGVGFRKDNPDLREAFNLFYAQLRLSGTYRELVKKYYPAVFDYYPDFF